MPRNTKISTLILKVRSDIIHKFNNLHLSMTTSIFTISSAIDVCSACSWRTWKGSTSIWLLANYLWGAEEVSNACVIAEWGACWSHVPGEFVIEVLYYWCLKYSIQAEALRFINTVVNTAPNPNGKVFHQFELIDAGFSTDEIEQACITNMMIIYKNYI